MNTKDPFDLDDTELARFLQTESPNPTAYEPDHPLRENQATAEVCELLEKFKSGLYHHRRPGGRAIDDAYFQFNEGPTLRPEIIVKFILDYARNNPGILSQ